MIDPNVVLKRMDEDVAETELDDKIVLLHIENGEYYNFNVTGSDLWRWLGASSSAHDLALKMANKYDCSVDACLPDILSWVNELLDKKIVTSKDAL